MTLSPNSPDSSESEGQRTKAYIAEITQGLFRASWWGITHQQVADIAGVDHATIAAHFPTLRSLVHYVYADEAAAMSTAIVIATAEMDAAQNRSARDAAVLNFVHTVAESIGQRPMLAMSMIPFMVDPWFSEDGKAPKMEEVTFDMLVRTLYALLSAHWKQSHPEHSSRLTERVAKQTMLGMLAAAANKRTEEDVIEATMYQLL
jgi:AcrR family transcriptional regulator